MEVKAEQPPPLCVGIVGCGRIGIVHMDTIKQCKGAQIVSIGGSSRPEAIKELAQKYNVDHYACDAKEVIDNPNVQAVWICSPSQFHAEQIRHAASLGKDIFCEKPIATNLEETIEAVKYAREKGVKLMVALQRRFDPNFLRVKECIRNNDTGTPVQVKLTSRDPAPPPFKYVKGGGGIFKDMAIHDLDMSRFLMGEEPQEIFAVGSCHIDKSIEVLEAPESYDTATIIVKYREGRTAMIDVCRQATYGYDQRAEVLGLEAMVMTENLYPTMAKTFTAERVGMADLPYDFFMSRYIEAYKAETLAFINAISKDKDAPITGEDGIVALGMAIAAGLSAKEKRWVKMAEVLPNMPDQPRFSKRERFGLFLRRGIRRAGLGPQ